MKLKFLLIPLLVPVFAYAALDTAKIEATTGLKGALNSDEGVFKVTSPRNDVKVSVDGWPMPPFMGLTSWAAFKDGMKEANADNKPADAAQPTQQMRSALPRRKSRRSRLPGWQTAPCRARV